MLMDFLIQRFEQNKEAEAIIWQDKGFSYGWLCDRFKYWKDVLESKKIRPGTVVILEADFSPNSLALFFALAECQCIIVPITGIPQKQKEEFVRIAEGELSIILDRTDDAQIRELPGVAQHALLSYLKQHKHPGLILFSSGSTGKSKAVVHDLVPLLEKFRTKRKAYRSIAFLLYDHIGGINTMLYILSNGGCLVLIPERNPDAVLAMVEKYKVDLLPTTPTFINLILLSEAYKRYDLSSLKLVTYGTEVMPESTLVRFHELFPAIELRQTYGLSEVGILRSKSSSSDSLWMKVGGEGFCTRVVDGKLHVKAETAMLGYLNAPGPFTDDGWLDTQDMVEVQGENIRILGRDSDIINVGGKKVYPAEVESVLQEMGNVEEAVVFGEENPITGQIVCAKVKGKTSAPGQGLVQQIKAFCKNKLDAYKIPVKVSVVDQIAHSDRLKKKRL